VAEQLREPERRIRRNLKSTRNVAARLRMALGINMQDVFLLQHLHVLPSGEEDAKVIGVYRSRAAAEAAVGRLQSQPGFRDHPNIVDEGSGFYIGKYPLDKGHWPEGYVTVEA
jgi:hypothetical protein